MKLIIEQEIFEKFSGLHLGVVMAKNISNKGFPEEISDKTKNLEGIIRQRHTSEILSQQPKIDAWRKAYSAFGAKPKEHKSSVENLFRLVLSGSGLRRINKLVDLYNFISLKHMLPVGGEDLDKIEGDILLTFAAENEAPVLLLGDKEARPPKNGEAIYKDGVSAICRRWNWREAERTKLTEETKNCILVIEGLPPVSREEIDVATKELHGLVEKYCGGIVRSEVLDEASPFSSIG
ncbi:MAG: phenylalanine--tRNA ligase beta subunit-related protein [Candidatus Micrarchaeota archaeon]